MEDNNIVYPRIFNPTMELKIIVTKSKPRTSFSRPIKEFEHKKLMQKWISQFTGEFEWREVEVEEIIV
jgi:hypothetical protein